MRMTSRSKVEQFCLQCIAPVLCSVCIGFLFFQDDVFDRRNGSFQFLWSAIVASALYYLLVHVRQRDANLGCAVLMGLTFLTTGSTDTAYILRDILYICAIGGSVYVYFYYFRTRAPRNPLTPAFILAGIYGVVYIITAEVHLEILRTFAMTHTGGTAVSLAHTTAFFGLLIGFAVGAGIAINEKWFNSAKI